MSKNDDEKVHIISIKREHLEKLERISKASGVSVDELIEKAMRAFMARQKKFEA